MKKDYLRDLMRDAWTIFRTTGETFADCLRKAWMLYKLGKAMRKRIVQFFYMKVNGEKRQAFGTLQPEYYEDNVRGTGRKPSELLFTYWDTEKGEFRAFKKFNIITIL